MGDIAQLYTDFEGTTVDSSGNTVPVHSKAIEVLRHQPDGGWKLVMGDPNWTQMIVDAALKGITLKPIGRCGKAVEATRPQAGEFL